MSKQEKFYNLPTEAPPLNRQVYEAAKAPFVYVFVMVWFVVRYWVYALPVAMLSAGLISFLVHQNSNQGGSLWTVAEQTFSVGLVWTGYLGAAFLAVRILQALFE